MKRIKTRALVFCAVLCFCAPGACPGLNAYDHENNSDVDLICGGVPEEGDEFELFDFRTGETSEVMVESREDTKDGISLVLSDFESGLVRRIDLPADGTESAGQ